MRPSRRALPEPSDQQPGAEGTTQGPEVQITGHVMEVQGETYAILEWSQVAHHGEPALSPSELEVMHAALRGWSNRQIAAARGTSHRTVANQLARVFSKLGVASRPQLFARFAEPFPGGPPREAPGIARPEAEAGAGPESTPGGSVEPIVES